MSARHLVLAAALVALLLPSAAARAQNPQLIGTVGFQDSFSISLTDVNGNPVSHLDAGTYDITVHDLSELHNFHLFGGAVNQLTSVGGTGDAQWTVTFTDGTYKFVCDAHPTVMHGSFTVGNVTTPPAPTRLVGSVGPGRRIALRYADGSKLSVLAGTNQVIVAVNDRSRTDNFHLVGNGVNRATGVAFRGKATWKLTLTPGAKYVYRSDRHKRLHGSFTVSGSFYPA